MCEMTNQKRHIDRGDRTAGILSGTTQSGTGAGTRHRGGQPTHDAPITGAGTRHRPYTHPQTDGAYITKDKHNRGNETPIGQCENPRTRVRASLVGAQSSRHPGGHMAPGLTTHPRCVHHRGGHITHDASITGAGTRHPGGHKAPPLHAPPNGRSIHHQGETQPWERNANRTMRKSSDLCTGIPCGCPRAGTRHRPYGQKKRRVLRPASVLASFRTPLYVLKDLVSLVLLYDNNLTSYYVSTSSDSNASLTLVVCYGLNYLTVHVNDRSNTSLRSDDNDLAVLAVNCC